MLRHWLKSRRARKAPGIPEPDHESTRDYELMHWNRGAWPTCARLRHVDRLAYQAAWGEQRQRSRELWAHNGGHLGVMV